DLPGNGQQALLEEPSPELPAPPSGTYPWITKSFWRISCESSTANGYPGEGFIAVSPKGVKYHFDYVVQVPTAKIVRGWNPGSSGTDSQNRNVVYFLVTRIEDRFGNWVTYQYSGNHLQSIASKDGRRIDLVWNGDNVASASSSLGTWRYGYDGTALRAVTRPDESKWQFASSGDMKILPDNSPPIYEQTPQCLPPFIGTGSFDYTITDPS